MNLFDFDPKTIFSFMLTLIRLSLVLFLLPFFGGNSIPNTVKAALCLVLTLGLWPALSFKSLVLPAHPFGLGLMVLGEILLGLVLALSVNFLFAAVQTGGQLIAFQMGFSMVNAVDPLTGTSEAATGHFLYMTSLLTFLSLNGHLLMLKALGASFKIIPPGGLLVTPGLAKHIFELSEQMFILGIQIAAPVIASIFLADLALALISRAAPQMNVLILGFPIKISLGFLFLGMLFSMMAIYMEQFVSHIGLSFGQIIRLGAP